MKKTLLNIICAIALAGAAALGSCSPLRNTAKENPTPATAANNEKTQKGRTDKNITLPSDRKELEAHADEKTYTPEEFAQGVIKGDWAIEKVNGKIAVGEVTPYIKFDEKEGRIYGNNGCNTINADYKYDKKDHSLKFINPLTTMRLCGMAGITDREITEAINQTSKYSLEKTNDNYLLNLYNSKGELLMQLSHQNLDFLNGTWKVTSIDGNEVDIEKMKLVFDIDEGKVHGNTGCNVLNGRLETNLDAPNTFSFEDMGVTMMYCPDIEYQTAMLVALEEACRAKPTSENDVMLLDADGKNVMTLQRTTDK